MAYDRADWHYGGNFPKDLPPEAGGTHIGLFLAWAILRGLEGEELRRHASASLLAVRERRMTGCDFLMQECDEKLVERCLNEEGNRFARAYYEKEGPGGYLIDYAETLGGPLPTLYHVQDVWANFDRLARSSTIGSRNGVGRVPDARGKSRPSACGAGGPRPEERPGDD